MEIYLQCRTYLLQIPLNLTYKGKVLEYWFKNRVSSYLLNINSSFNIHRKKDIRLVNLLL